MKCFTKHYKATRGYAYHTSCRTAVDFAIEARCEKPLWSFFQDRHGVALTNWGRRQFLAEEGKGKGKGEGK